MKTLILSLILTISLPSFGKMTCKEYAQNLLLDTVVETKKNLDAKEAYLSQALFGLSIGMAALSTIPQNVTTEAFITIERTVDNIDIKNKSRKELLDRQLAILSEGLERLVNECL